MKLAVSTLSLALVVSTTGALVGSACGDDSSGDGEGGGSSGTSSTTDSAAPGATGSTGAGGEEDPCSNRPPACFDDALCYVDIPKGVSLRNDLIPLMQRSCTLSSACHTNPASPTTSQGYKPYLGVKLSEGESDIPKILAAIVDVEAWGDPSKSVVVPGEPENSYFMYKLDGALDSCPELDCPDGCGRLMPQGSPKPLPLAERNLFRAWIAEGAQDN